MRAICENQNLFSQNFIMFCKNDFSFRQNFIMFCKNDFLVPADHCRDRRAEETAPTAAFQALTVAMYQ